MKLTTNRSKANRSWELVVVAFVLGGFVLDLVTPRGYSDWLIYLLAIVLAMEAVSRFKILLAGTMATVLIILGFILSMPGGSFWGPLYSRFLGIVLIWTAVWAALRWHRADEALRRSEERYRLLFERNLAGVFRSTLDGILQDCNDACARILGYATKEELLSQSVKNIYCDVADRNSYIAQLQKEKNVTNIEFQYKRKDGSSIWVLENASLVEPDHGEPAFIEGTFFDITKRKRAEAENARLMTAIEQSADEVMITDIQGNIEYVNPAFTRITGYSREEALGQNPRILKSGRQDTEFYDHLWKTILRGEVWHGEVVNRRKDGSLYTEEMDIAPVRNHQGGITHFIATKQDVTARLQLEEQFRQAQKMEAVGRLAAGVAHDFNNLLTVINGYSQLLLDRLEPQSPFRVNVTEVLKAGESATALTRQLLAFGRRQVLAPKVLDLNETVRNLQKTLLRLIGEDVECRTALQADLWKVRADPGQIEQIIMNLAVNARDAMPQGGTLTVETANIDLDATYASTHSGITPGCYVVLSMSDTGVGMDGETQARIFEPFFTTKEPGKGTGLGLAMVYGIVKQSGGHIWVYSEPGKGSTFKIYLPWVEGEVGSEEAGKVGRGGQRGTETILLVEDEAGVRTLVASVLEEKGYDVLVASNPDEAAQLSAGYAKTIHLLLTDLVMPKWSGRHLAEHLLFTRRTMKVLYMSGYTDDSIIHQGILKKGSPFLQKPFSPDTLLRKVREVLEA